jgi:uncharacterized delta-60 repeat protein
MNKTGYTVAAGQDAANLTVTGLDLNGGSLDKAGTLGFAASTSVGAGAYSLSVAAADIDKDGDIDLLVANAGNNNVAVRLNDGTGNFSASTFVGVGNDPQNVTVADMNGDGFLDLLTANKGSNTVSVRLGDGKGGFAGSTEVGVSVGTLGVTTADVDRDGDLDILAVRFNPSTSSDRSVSVRLNDGQGGFSGNTEVGVGTNPRSVTTADVNGDGILDILTANQGASSVSVALGNGQGGVSSTTNYGMGNQPYSVAAADLNGDGRITANNNGNVSVRLVTFGGQFTALTQVRVGSGSLSLTVADVNGDGILDILAANYNDNTVSVRLGDGKGGFSGTTDLTVGTHPLDVKAADVNGDGRLDIIAANADSGTVSVILNTSIVPVTFDGASVSRTTAGAATGFAIDATAPALTGTQTALTGSEDTATFLTTAQLLDGWTDTAGLTVTGVSVTHGTIVADYTGGYRITPDADYNGPLVVSYTVSDGTNPVAATRTVALAAVNDAPSFNGPGTGKVLTPVGAGTSLDRGYSVFVQADGKIVVAGQGIGADNTSDFAVVRYNRDGSLDTTFGTGGKILTPVGSVQSSDIGRSVFVQADGMIVVAGQGTGPDASNDFAVVRYDRDGNLDATFGTGGKILTPVGTSSDIGRSVFVQADGKIVVAGNSNAATGISDFAVVRYNSNGSFDTSFNGTGKVRTAFTGNPDTAYSVTVQADGKIVVAGSTGNRDFAVLRYNTDGTLDTGFGADKTGQITVSDPYFDIGQSVLIQADGKIVVAGQSYTTSGNYVVRYNTDGTLDAGFGAGGKLPSFVGGLPYSAALQQDGKIVVAGSSITSGSDFTVTRYDVNGSLDTTFGTGGKVATPVGPGTSSDIGYSVTVQADGKIVVAGSSSNVGNGTNIDFAVVRYNSDGSLDTTFNPQGSLGGTVAFTEDGAAVRLDTDVALSDIDLDGLNGGLGDYAGATLTLARQGGANAQDAFGFEPDGFTVSGNSLRDASGTVFATFTTTGGTLVVTFTGANVATSALADAVARAVAYANTSDTPPASVALAWTFSDGGADAKTTTGLTTVAITAVNDAPALTGTKAVLAAGTEDTAFTVSAAELLQGFADPEGTALVLSDVAVDHGTITGDSVSGYTITPTADTNGPLVISYRVGDGTLSTAASLTKTLAAVNDAPRLTGTQATLAAGTEDTAFTVTTAQLLQGFTDPDGTTSVVTNLTVDHGSIAEDGAGGYTITPADNYNGPITISYRVGDGTVSLPASLSITLVAVNDAPVLARPASVTIAENAAPGTVIATLAATDVDDATAALRYAITDGNADGLFAIDAVTGAVTLAAGKHLDHEAATSHTLTIVATDPAGLPSATFGGPKGNALTIAVTDVNEATAITATASRAGTLTVGDTVTFTLTTESPVGAAGTPKLILSNGASAGFTGLDAAGKATFTYTVEAGQDTTDFTVTGLSLDGGSLNKGGTFGFAAAQDVTVGGYPFSVTTADLDRDGTLDLLTATSDGTVSVRLGNGNGTFGDATRFSIGNETYRMTVADVNGDGNLDILAASTVKSGTVSVRLGDGQGGFGAETGFSVGGFPQDLVTADVNGDGRLDVLTANARDGTVSVRLGGGDGTFSGTTDVRVGQQPRSVAVADVDGDRKLDILTANYDSGTVSVRLGNGDGTFGGTTDVPVGSFPQDVTVADVNGDGALDILSANYGGRSVSLRLGDGTGSFSGTTNITFDSSVTGVTTADLNGDGKLDLIATLPFGKTIAVRLGDGNGGFGGTTDLLVGDSPGRVTTADVNGDGRLDLLVANAFSGTVSVLLNTSTQGLSFDPASVSGATSGAVISRAIDTTAPALTGAQAALAAGIEDTAYTVTKAQLLEGWADAGSATLTVTGLTASGGTVTAHADGSYTITPAADANGPVTLSYRVGDGLNTAAATRAFTLDAVNDAPLAADDVPDLAQRGTVTGNLLANDRHPDGDGFALKAIAVGDTTQTPGPATAITGGAVTLTGRYGHLTLAADGGYTYAADIEGRIAVGASAEDDFTYTVVDAQGDAVQARLRVTVFETGEGDAGANTFLLSRSGTEAAGQGGNDVYRIDGTDVSVIEAVGGGKDTVLARVDFALGAGQEVEILRADAGTTGLELTGNERANNLYSGAGDDRLIGGAGNDLYLIDDAGDRVFEAAGEGADKVMASVSYALTAGQEIEKLTTVSAAGTEAIALTGNGFVQTIQGNAGANILDGGGGADVLQGYGGDDTYLVDDRGDLVFEAVNGGNDTIRTSVSYGLVASLEIETLKAADGTAAIKLTGNELAQTLEGNAGANLLDGRGGADTLYGLAGNDTYLVDDAGDLVFETVGGGADKVMASVGYALTAGQEIEKLTTVSAAGTEAIALTGNGFVQTIQGNAGANVLDGGGGADVLQGYGGDDTYLVDDRGDLVFEAVNGGNDTIRTSVSYGLVAGLEIETLRAADGTAAIKLTGNELAQTLEGNAGANLLDGRGGADTLYGLAGNDTYLVDDAGDLVFETVGGGADKVMASVGYALTAGQEIEKLTTVSAAGTEAIALTGNGFVQTIQGNAGANVLDGKGGADVLQGFGGSDSFVFSTTLGRDNVDRIVDFARGVDKIVLSAAIFDALPEGTLSAAAFKDVAQGALDDTDRIVYDSRSGALSYDADGSGAKAAIQFAVIDTKVVLTHTDLLVA